MVYKKHYRKPGQPSSRPQGGQRVAPAGGSKKKGALSFFFSFKGAISRELFVGASLTLGLISLATSSVFNIASITNDTVLTALSAFQVIVLISLVSIGYKRAHALGMSGFYSIVGTSIFAPFFMFFRPANDSANDGAYLSRYESFKKIGAFFTKNAGRHVLYLLVIYAASMTVSVFASGELRANDMTQFLMLLLVFNMVQIPLLKRAWLRKYYMPIVKVLSFAAYNALIIGIAMVAAYMQIMSQLMRSVGPMM